MGLLGCCCGTGYALNALLVTGREIFGKHENASPVQNGALSRHVNEVARKMGLHKEIEVLELSNRTHLTPEFKRLLPNSVTFGGSLIPSSPAGIILKEEVAEDMATEDLKYLLSQDVAAIKINKRLWISVASLVVGIASTILLLPVAPIGAYFAGSAIGACAAFVTKVICDLAIHKMVNQHAPRDEYAY